MDTKLVKSIAIISFFALITLSCSPKKPELSPQQLTNFTLLSTEADLLYERGGYVSLKKAYAIYEDLQTFPALQNRILRKLAKTALLLAIRENELDIIGDEYLTKALELIESYPELSEFSSYAAIVLFSSRRGNGIPRRGLNGQYNREENYQWTNKNIVPLNADLKEKAETDVFYSYFYLTLNASFPYNIKEEDDFTRFLDIFPNSPLIQYKLSLFPKFDQKRMEDLLKSDPEFYEAHFFLGDRSLNLGNTLTAEKSFLQAYEKIPASISVLTRLTKIHFLLEEFDLSLEYNENILELAPEYRDSLLGKAICLGYLSRHEEALNILNMLIELGMYLMGESHYWLAWNQHEIGQLEPAWENIKRASNYLIGHFENAALCNAGLERVLQKKIKELEDSTLNPSRKEKHITKKKIQMKKVQVTKATAFYNAAAGYFNTGQNEKALELAQNARDSKALKSKVDELINKIKEKEKTIQKGNKATFQLYSLWEQ